TILFAFVKNAILISSGVDCFTTSSQIAFQQASAVTNTITAYGGSPPTQTDLRALTSLRHATASPISSQRMSSGTLFSASDLIADGANLALRDQALAQIRGALDTTRTNFGLMGSYLSVALGKTAVPFIRVAAPLAPAQVMYGDTTTVSVTATNFGSGSAHAVR